MLQNVCGTRETIFEVRPAQDATLIRHRNCALITYLQFFTSWINLRRSGMQCLGSGHLSLSGRVYASIVQRLNTGGTTVRADDKPDGCNP